MFVELQVVLSTVLLKVNKNLPQTGAALLLFTGVVLAKAKFASTTKSQLTSLAKVPLSVALIPVVAVTVYCLPRIRESAGVN